MSPLTWQIHPFALTTIIFLLYWQPLCTFCPDNHYVHFALTTIIFLLPWEPLYSFCTDNHYVPFALKTIMYLLPWQPLCSFCPDNHYVPFALTTIMFLLSWQPLFPLPWQPLCSFGHDKHHILFVMANTSEDIYSFYNDKHIAPLAMRSTMSILSWQTSGCHYHVIAVNQQVPTLDLLPLWYCCKAVRSMLLWQMECPFDDNTSITNYSRQCM